MKKIRDDSFKYGKVKNKEKYSGRCNRILVENAANKLNIEMDKTEEPVKKQKSRTK